MNLPANADENTASMQKLKAAWLTTALTEGEAIMSCLYPDQSFDFGKIVARLPEVENIDIRDDGTYCTTYPL